MRRQVVVRHGDLLGRGADSSPMPSQRAQFGRGMGLCPAL